MACDGSRVERSCHGLQVMSMSTSSPPLPDSHPDSRSADLTSDDTLARLAAVIESRRGGDPDKSYVARLLSKGLDAMLKKVGEEATEVVMASKDGVPERVVGEVADLWFHCFVALSQFNLRPEDVIDELNRRAGISGIAEKASRK